MTEKQQRIYNMYLQAASLGVGHPFKMRKDFEGFEESNPEDYAAILKLEKLFNDLPGLNIYDYFAAPYKLDKERFNYKLELKWYLTFMGMKYYKQTFYHQFEHNCLSHEETKADIEEEFDKVAGAIQRGCPLKSILVAEDEITPPKWVNLYCKHEISDWFLIAFACIGKDLMDSISPMFREGIVSEDHKDFIEKNLTYLENPQKGAEKLFLTNQIRKLVAAEKERGKKAVDNDGGK